MKAKVNIIPLCWAPAQQLSEGQANRCISQIISFLLFFYTLIYSSQPEQELQPRQAHRIKEIHFLCN